jgi:hypothetical protein
LQKPLIKKATENCSGIPYTPDEKDLKAVREGRAKLTASAYFMSTASVSELLDRDELRLVPKISPYYNLDKLDRDELRLVPKISPYEDPTKEDPENIFRGGSRGPLPVEVERALSRLKLMVDGAWIFSVASIFLFVLQGMYVFAMPFGALAAFSLWARFTS